MAKKVPESVLDTLDRLIQDDTVPRSVRRVASEIKEKLLSSKKVSVEAASAITVLEDISTDPNLPMHVRTMIWNLASQLERISVE
ncbi:MAG: UPF0147 family protein [Archaeoglobales archaeon]|jgi:uncharacterized protein (UPF0147 family)|nr:UPF0147 family protein [Archaeoglobales archaeon]TDA24967.1 MAG: hypothetical protein DSO01_08850 [Archaeoglobi archaeon]TDA26231.1 MAG: hypothetical protein DSN99_06770 [Archaeoglobi archaeon]TDA28554.1 MAG: hypothetical protein DSO00_05710 [Archaeoglobi archaeon]